MSNYYCIGFSEFGDIFFSFKNDIWLINLILKILSLLIYVDDNISQEINFQ